MRDWLPPWWGFGLVVLWLVAVLILGPVLVCGTHGCGPLL